MDSSAPINQIGVSQTLTLASGTLSTNTGDLILSGGSTRVVIPGVLTNTNR